MTAPPASIVVDTNALVWFATGNGRRLSRKARQAFAAFETGACAMLVPAPVLMELWFLSLNGTIAADPSFRSWWRSLKSDFLIEIPLEHEDVLLAAELAWPHRDPQDRLIVATALRLEAPLLTADEAIRAWGGVEVYW